jgi:hypothetical protein
MPNALDDLERAVSALKGLTDLLGSASDYNAIGPNEFSCLFWILTDEVERCATALRAQRQAA